MLVEVAGSEVGLLAGRVEREHLLIRRQAEGNDNLVAIEEEPRPIVVRRRLVLRFNLPHGLELDGRVIGDGQAAQRRERRVAEHSLHLVARLRKAVIGVVEHECRHVVKREPSRRW